MSTEKPPLGLRPIYCPQCGRVMYESPYKMSYFCPQGHELTKKEAVKRGLR